MAHLDIHKALESLRPGAQWSCEGFDYAHVQWHDTVQTMPAESEVIAEAQRLQTEHENNEYQRLRARAYPSIGDQLDALFHAGVFPADMAARIQAVKDQYPKP